MPRSAAGFQRSVESYPSAWYDLDLASGVLGRSASAASAATLAWVTCAQIVRVDVLQQVAELHAVLYAHVLMLMREVLVRFDEATRRRIPGVLKRFLIAAAQEPIGAEDLAHLKSPETY